MAPGAAGLGCLSHLSRLELLLLAARAAGWPGEPSLRASDDEQMERWKAGRRYLSLGSPQHVLLLLKDGVDALKELGALFGDPAKTSRNRLTTIHLGPEIKRREDMLS